MALEELTIKQTAIATFSFFAVLAVAVAVIASLTKSRMVRGTVLSTATTLAHIHLILDMSLQQSGKLVISFS